MYNNSTEKCILIINYIIFLSILMLSGCGQKSDGSNKILVNEISYMPGNINNKDLIENSTGDDLEKTLEIEVSEDFTVKAKIYSQRDYKHFLEQLKDIDSCCSLYLNLGNTNTIIYLDEFLKDQNIEYLEIENGGTICAKDTEFFRTYSLYSVRLKHISAIQGKLFDQFSGSEIRIRLDNKYIGTLPIIDLLNNIHCADIALIWDNDNGFTGKEVFNEREAYGREWEYYCSILSDEALYLKGLYRVNQEHYNYTSYEFSRADSNEICAAFICIKDIETNGETYFDILSIPDSALPNILRQEGKRIYFGDINFDGYDDLLFLGNNDRINVYNQCTSFLWDCSQKRYTLCETAPVNFKRIDPQKERLIYSTSGSVFDDEYYIYKYDGNRFEEERLDVSLSQSEEGTITWQYFKDSELQKKLEVDFDKATDTYIVSYCENGNVQRETLTGEDISNVWDIGKKYFPAFDFYNFG